jgi:hypothetical protein
MSDLAYDRDYALSVAQRFATGSEGSFAEHLARAFFAADSRNAALIVQTWPHMFLASPPATLTLEERVARLEASQTGVDPETVASHISLRELADYVARKVPGYLDYDDLAAALDIDRVADNLTGRRGLVSDIAGYIDVSDIAEHFDADDIAGYIDVSDIAEHVAGHIDSEELAGLISMRELAAYVDTDKLAHTAARSALRTLAASLSERVADDE